MVVEHLFSSKRIESHPWLVAIMAFLFVAIAVSITRLIYFGDSGPRQESPLYGMFIIALAIMPAIPFFLHEIIMEEKRQEHRCKGGVLSILTCYSRLIKFYAYFFVGTALGFAFCAAILPQDISSAMFLAQKNEYTNILRLSSKVTAPAQGYALSFSDIFINNAKVLVLMLIFSFIYSIGSIFLLVWNASLMGIFLVAYPGCILDSIVTYSKFGLLAFPTGFLVGSFNGLIRLLPHGIFEILAFFVASISGGILSVAIERRVYRKSNVTMIVIDVAFFFLLSVILLAIGAWIESSYA